jgi:hypothetical protein
MSHNYIYIIYVDRYLYHVIAESRRMYVPLYYIIPRIVMLYKCTLRGHRHKEPKFSQDKAICNFKCSQFRNQNECTKESYQVSFNLFGLCLTCMNLLVIGKVYAIWTPCHEQTSQWCKTLKVLVFSALTDMQKMLDFCLEVCHLEYFARFSPFIIKKICHVLLG